MSKFKIVALNFKKSAQIRNNLLPSLCELDGRARGGIVFCFYKREGRKQGEGNFGESVQNSANDSMLWTFYTYVDQKRMAKLSNLKDKDKM